MVGPLSTPRKFELYPIKFNFGGFYRGHSPAHVRTKSNTIYDIISLFSTVHEYVKRSSINWFKIPAISTLLELSYSTNVKKLFAKEVTEIALKHR